MIEVVEKTDRPFAALMHELIGILLQARQIFQPGDEPRPAEVRRLLQRIETAKQSIREAYPQADLPPPERGPRKRLQLSKDSRKFYSDANRMAKCLDLFPEVAKELSLTGAELRREIRQIRLLHRLREGLQTLSQYIGAALQQAQEELWESIVRSIGPQTDASLLN